MSAAEDADVHGGYEDGGSGGGGEDETQSRARTLSAVDGAPARRTLSNVHPEYLAGAYGESRLDPGPAAAPPPARLKPPRQQQNGYHPTGALSTPRGGGGYEDHTAHGPQAAYRPAAGHAPSCEAGDPAKPYLGRPGGGGHQHIAPPPPSDDGGAPDIDVQKHLMDIKKRALLRLTLASTRGGGGGAVPTGTLPPRGDGMPTYISPHRDSRALVPLPGSAQAAGRYPEQQPPYGAGHPHRGWPPPPPPHSHAHPSTGGACPTCMQPAPAPSPASPGQASLPRVGSGSRALQVAEPQNQMRGPGGHHHHHHGHHAHHPPPHYGHGPGPGPGGPSRHAGGSTSTPTARPFADFPAAAPAQGPHAWPPPPPPRASGLQITSSPLTPYGSQPRRNASEHAGSVARPRAGMSIYEANGMQHTPTGHEAHQGFVPPPSAGGCGGYGDPHHGVPPHHHGQPRGEDMRGWDVGRLEAYPRGAGSGGQTSPPRHARGPNPAPDGAEVRWKRVVDRDQRGELVETVRWIREVVSE